MNTWNKGYANDIDNERVNVEWRLTYLYGYSHISCNTMEGTANLKARQTLHIY